MIFEVNEKCSQCSSDATYPMLMNCADPRTLCASNFHDEWYDFAFRPTLWKLIKRWWNGW